MMSNKETYKPARLSILAASREFNISRTALKARLGDVQPGDDGLYSIMQIASAIYGSLHQEKLRILRAQAAIAERKAQVQRGDLIKVDTLKKALANGLTAMRGAIENSHATDNEIECFFEAGRNMLHELQAGVSKEAE